MALHAALEEVGAGIDRAFDALLPVPDDARARLYEAMRYAAIGGGKRIRPLLVIAACDLFKVDPARSRRAASLRRRRNRETPHARRTNTTEKARE